MTQRSTSVKHAAQLLREGKLVAIPTETVYGLAGNGFNEAAIKAIFETKQRPFYDPLILHTHSIEKIADWGMNLPEPLAPLAEKFWPGPLTLLMQRSSQVSDFVTSGLPRVAFRIPQHPLTLQLLAELDFPLAAPSANPFGFVSPTTPEHVLQHFEGKIDMVLDGGQCTVGIESTIVGVEGDQVIIYRLGGLAVEEIEAVVGRVSLRTSSSKPDAPGMLQRHYAPNKPVVTVTDQKSLSDAFSTHPNAGCMLYNLSAPSACLAERVFRLSDKQDSKEAAAKFYNALRMMSDDRSIETILVERLPDFALGRAINDRLRRAAVEEDQK